MKKLLLKTVVRLITLAATISLAGCAGYSITKNGDGGGYDVYKPEPYLLITPGEKGPSGEVVWLPNYNERYRIDTWNFFGKADFVFDISDGWKLTKISDKGDNTAIASKLMDIVQKSARPDAISLTGQVQLLRFVYDSAGHIVGMKQVLVQEASD